MGERIIGYVLLFGVINEIIVSDETVTLKETPVNTDWC